MAVRTRSGGDEGVMALADFIAQCRAEIDEKSRRFNRLRRPHPGPPFLLGEGDMPKFPQARGLAPADTMPPSAHPSRPPLHAQARTRLLHVIAMKIR